MTGYANVMRTYVEYLPDGRMLTIDPPNYQVMYRVALWGVANDDTQRIAIGGCESFAEVLEEAHAWVESL